MNSIRLRSIIEYNLNELDIIKTDSKVLYNEIKSNSLKGINTIYKNQEKCGEAIKNIFDDKSKIICLSLGMTQTGKTGCMTSVINSYMKYNNIPIENIYIITGLSDTEWKKDTIYRMPNSIKQRVFHRPNLSEIFINDIKTKKNLLIIMDEIQIACIEDQTIHKTFKECGFYDLDFLLENDIKIIQFSATPDGNINDIMDWENHSAKIKLEPGLNYYGAKQALEQNRVKQFKDLTKIENVKDLKRDIEKNFNNPRYHLIRVPNKINNQSLVISNLKEIFGKNYEYNESYLKSKKDDINLLLKIQPEKNTIVFYCEILRCAKTQHKKYIGISYERYGINISDSSIVQGSFGRLTGYDDNGDSICYTNIPSLENYIKLWDNDMNFKKGIVWNTNTTLYNMKNDITSIKKPTFNNVDNIEQLNKTSLKNEEKSIDEPIIKKFYGEKGQTEMINWFKDKLKNIMPTNRGPNRKKINDDGFYYGSIRKGLEILSTEKVYKERNWGFSAEKDGIRSYPCYSNIKDPKTLEWWLVYYDNK